MFSMATNIQLHMAPKAEQVAVASWVAPRVVANRVQQARYCCQSILEPL